MSLNTWSIADAKTRLNEVLNLAEREAQVIIRRNRDFVVLDGEAYRRLTDSVPTLQQVILRGPSLAGVDLERDSLTGRDVAL